MTNFNQLLISAKNRGFEFEAFTNIAKQALDRKNPLEDFELNKQIYGFGKSYEKLSTFVTIKISKNTYATWEFIGAELDHGFFSVYNAASGYTMKTYKQERKALNQLGL